MQHAATAAWPLATDANALQHHTWTAPRAHTTSTAPPAIRCTAPIMRRAAQIARRRKAHQEKHPEAKVGEWGGCVWGGGGGALRHARLRTCSSLLVVCARAHAARALCNATIWVGMGPALLPVACLRSSPPALPGAAACAGAEQRCCCTCLLSFHAHQVISLGIGDTTEPLPKYIADAMAKAAAGLATPAGYSG